MVLASLVTILLLILTPDTALAAYQSDICQGESKCTQTEVGVFLKDISVACGNSGDCSLADIITVFVNIGNYVVGIIGAVALLMYVVGGFYWLASAGRTEWVSKGKKYMTISTIGLLIVIFSYLAILTLRNALKTGDITTGGYFVCSGPEVAGKPCDVNANCDATGYVCEYK